MLPQDTFSFALVLLCLAMGDINYVVSLRFTRAIRYHLGKRPLIPAELDFDHEELVQLIVSMWQKDFRLRPAMKAVVATLTNLTPSSNDGDGSSIVHTSSNATDRVAVRLLSEGEVAEAKRRHESSPKPFAVFLSHRKETCAAEAELVKLNYEALIGAECFLGKSMRVALLRLLASL